MAGKLNVKILKDKKAVAAEAASLIARAIKAKPDFTLGLATGSTPEGAYAELAKLNKAKRVDFSKVKTFNLDEYWGLDGSHEQSYRFFMQKKFFSKINIAPWNTYILDGNAKNPMLECSAFETRILAVGGIDLWLLGIGANGHIAFNEPGSSVDSRTRLVSLTPSTIAANSDGRFFSDPNDVPRCALSAGIGTIREARRIILLATGENKARAVADALEGPFSPDCPASLLQDHPDITFILDRAAASELKKKPGKK